MSFKMQTLHFTQKRAHASGIGDFRLAGRGKNHFFFLLTLTLSSCRSRSLCYHMSASPLQHCTDQHIPPFANEGCHNMFLTVGHAALPKAPHSTQHSKREKPIRLTGSFTDTLLLTLHSDGKERSIVFLCDKNGHLRFLAQLDKGWVGLWGLAVTTLYPY